jgi:SAM-dependent methyltransferase
VIDVLELPFDQYQRYRLAADLLEEVRPRGATWKILDVGGRTALLRSFLPKDRVTLVDLETSAEPGLVLGDGARLPFADASFDVVTAFDTLEHVPPPLRDAFLAECRRVAKTYVAIVGPYQHPAVEESERLLQRFLKEKLGVEHRYLEEHRHHGLPDRARVEAQLSASGATVVSIGHGNLERWLALICLSLYMDYTYELRGVAARFFRFYNGHLYASDHAAPVYRHAIVAGLRGAPLPTGKAALAAPTTPPGAVARMTELAFELADFERAHKALHDERDVLRQIVATLEKDLDGHRKVLAEERDVRVRLEGDIAGLQGELRASLDSMRSVQDVLKQNDAKITELRSLLRGRWKNLKRALGPKPPIP